MALKFIRELRRRRVLRTASIYVVGAWLFMQVADIIFPALGLPDIAMRKLLYALAAGFPLALIAGWYFDITRGGIRLTKATDEELPPLVLEDYAMLAVVVFVSGLIAFTLWPEPESDIGITGAIAVMPFEDASAPDAIGSSFSDEIIGVLKRVPGIWVPGRDSSRHYKDADPVRAGVALGVGAILRGTIRRSGDRISIEADLFGTRQGKRIRSLRQAVPVEGLLDAQDAIVNAVIDEIMPSAQVPVAMSSGRAGEACAPVYDTYLRARQIAVTPGKRALEIRQKAVDLLQQATRDAPGCGLAWAGLAHAYFHTAPQFQGGAEFEKGMMPAGAAARRALEIDDTLADAWIILAEIAEQGRRFVEAENMFIKALLAEPANADANSMFGEALLARGRVRDGLHYAMEAYRHDPASRSVAFRAGLAAKMAGDGDLAVRFGNIMRDLSQQAFYDGFDEIARGHMLNGDIARALEEFRSKPDQVPGWFLGCVEAQADASLIPQARERLREQFQSADVTNMSSWYLIVCGTWLEEADLVVELLLGDRSVDVIAEAYYYPFFFSEATALRQHPRFRQFVEDSGLLEYWYAVGWSDYCEPEGDSFRCR